MENYLFLLFISIIDSANYLNRQRSTYLEDRQLNRLLKNIHYLATAFARSSRESIPAPIRR
jgi:hypothetical protein